MWIKEVRVLPNVYNKQCKTIFLLQKCFGGSVQYAIQICNAHFLLSLYDNAFMNIIAAVAHEWVVD